MLVASIGGRAEHGLQVFFDWVPRFAGAIVVLVVGYIVARLVGSVIARALHRVGFDRTLHGGIAGNMIQRVTAKPSGLLGRIAFWAIMLGAVSLAASVLGIAALTAFVGAVWAYLPNVIAAIVIFLVAGALAAGAAALVSRTMGDSGLGRIAATVAPVLIMAIASFMILDQLKIAQDIVVITYAALLGAVALGSAIAFGLGGRDVASRILGGAYDGAQQNKGEWKRGMENGRTVAQGLLDDAKQQARPSSQRGPAPHSA